jgi:hypothetical protein
MRHISPATTQTIETQITDVCANSQKQQQTERERMFKATSLKKHAARRKSVTVKTVFRIECL